MKLGGGEWTNEDGGGGGRIFPRGRVSWPRWFTNQESSKDGRSWKVGQLRRGKQPYKFMTRFYRPPLLRGNG